MCLLMRMCETLAHSMSAAFGEITLNKDHCNAFLEYAPNGLMIEHVKKMYGSLVLERQKCVMANELMLYTISPSGSKEWVCASESSMCLPTRESPAGCSNIYTLTGL